MDYTDLIDRWLLEANPQLLSRSDNDLDHHFEAVSSVVFGTKQRRNGPMPSPEVQVKIRQVIKNAIEKNCLTIFVPFGSRKQVNGYPLDILEFCAIRQLRGLQEGLKVLGLPTHWVFRIENLADRYLFEKEPNNTKEIHEYHNTLYSVIKMLLDSSSVGIESAAYDNETYLALCLAHTIMFENYLKGSSTKLPGAWKGGVSVQQRAEFERCYNVMYPGQDPTPLMARYFATVSARYTLGTGMVPEGEYLTATFHRPRHYPTDRLFLHVRTVPERYTHLHREPWLARGYVEFDEPGLGEPPNLTIKIADSFRTDGLEMYHATIPGTDCRVRCDFKG